MALPGTHGHYGSEQLVRGAGLVPGPFAHGAGHDHPANHSVAGGVVALPPPLFTLAGLEQGLTRGMAGHVAAVGGGHVPVLEANGAAVVVFCGIHGEVTLQGRVTGQVTTTTTTTAAAAAAAATAAAEGTQL